MNVFKQQYLVDRTALSKTAFVICDDTALQVVCPLVSGTYKHLQNNYISYAVFFYPPFPLFSRVVDPKMNE